MEINIEQALADFELKLKNPTAPASKPVKKTAAPKATVVEHPPSSPPVGAPCVNKNFKELVKALTADFIGIQIKDFLIEFMDTQLPECPTEGG